MRVVQTLLFVMGINTLLQTLFGTRLPTVIGGSYAFMVPIISIIHDSKLTRIEDPHTVSHSVQIKPYSTLFIYLFVYLLFVEISQHNEGSSRSPDSGFKHTNNPGIQSNLGNMFQVHNYY